MHILTSGHCVVMSNENPHFSQDAPGAMSGSDLSP